MRSRCPQRKRSSSLPVPKIEVSLCSSSYDGKSKETPSHAKSTDCFDQSRHYSGITKHWSMKACTFFFFVYCIPVERIDTIGLTSTGSSPTEQMERKEQEINSGQSNHMANNSTGGTKRRKMADLKAFVETRLLSRSHDKMLEKIDFKNSSTAHNNRTQQQLLSAPETVRYLLAPLSFPLLIPFVLSRNHTLKKFIFSLYFFCSLDQREEEKYPASSKRILEKENTIPPRPLSALASVRDDNDFARRSYLMQEPTPLVKGKSMPSLR